MKFTEFVFACAFVGVLLTGCQKEDEPREKPAKHVKKGDFISFEFEGKPYKGFVVSDAAPRSVQGRPKNIQFRFWVDPSDALDGSDLASPILFGSPVLPEEEKVFPYLPSKKFQNLCYGIHNKSFLQKARSLFFDKYAGFGWQGHITNGFAVITGFTGSGGSIHIPKKWNGTPVHQIGTGFWEPVRFDEPPLEISIPDGVTSIADYAFAGNYHLARVIFPRTLRKIGQRAFDDCHSLERIEIPEGVAEIGSGAFIFCLQLKEIYVADGNPFFSSKDGVLYNKNQSTLIQFPAGRGGEFAIPDSVNVIGEDAFRYNSNLSRIVIPSSVQTIENFAFELSDNIESFFIPGSIQNIGDGAFTGCLKLSKIVVDDNNPNYSSSEGVLYNKEGTILIQYAYGRQESSFSVPKGVLEIGNYAFRNCTNLKSVTLPEGLRKVGKGAFECAQNLEEIQIPGTLNYFGKSAFSVDSPLSSETLRRIESIQKK